MDNRDFSRNNNSTRPVTGGNNAERFSPFDWLFAALCFNAMIYNEVVGSVLLYLVFVVMIAVVAAYPVVFFRIFEGQKAILLLLPAYCLISSLWSPIPGFTMRSALQSALVVALAVTVCRSIPARSFIHIVFLSTTVAIILGFIVNHRVLDSMTNEINWSGIYYNKNSMSMIGVLFGLCCAQHAMDRKRHSVSRLLYLSILPLSYVVCYAAKSVAMLVILTIGLGFMTMIYLVLMFPRRFIRSTIEQFSILTLIICTVGFFIISNFSGDLLRLAGKSETLTGRTVLWDWAGKIIPGKFWLGWGYGGFWVQGNPLAEELWRINHVASRGGFHFHNLIYQAWIDLGIFGVAVIVITIMWTFLLCYRWVYHAQDITSGFYLSSAIVMMVSQYQDVQLFGGFGTMSLLFTIAGVYAHDSKLFERVRIPHRRRLERSSANLKPHHGAS